VSVDHQELSKPARLHTVLSHKVSDKSAFTPSTKY